MTSLRLPAVPRWLYALFCLWLLLTLAGALYNGGPVRLGRGGERFRVRVYNELLKNKELSPVGLALAKSWIETRTRPAYGILTLVWQHLWYNCITSGYECVVWFEPPDRVGESYAVYQSGHTIFLRIEPHCWHRVLVAEFTAAELQALIASHAVSFTGEYDPHSGR